MGYGKMESGRVDFGKMEGGLNVITLQENLRMLSGEMMFFVLLDVVLTS